MATRRRITHDAGMAALRQVAAAPGEGAAVSRATEATAVRYLLEELAAVAPGNSVEVRVPPFGATQCIQGPRHTRGTPPNVVEMPPAVWLALATGRRDWAAAHAAGEVLASGARADLSGVLPLVRV